MRKPRSFGVSSNIYVALLCLVLFVGVGIVAKFDRGRLEKVGKKRRRKKEKKRKEKYIMLREIHWAVLRLHEKKLYRKLMQTLNDHTHPIRDYFGSRRSNRSARFLLSRTNTNRYNAPLPPIKL